MKKKNRAAIVVGLCAAYFICYFTKLSPSAVMPMIQEELGLTSSQVGFISGIYFFSYAIMQFFTGSLCKRFTAPKVIMTGMFLASFGLKIFATAKSFGFLVLGRFLIGLGISPIFIGLLCYFQECYEGDEYVRAYGYSIVVGNLSSVCASTPLKALLKVADRNVVFTAITFASILVGLYLATMSFASGEKGDKSSSENVLKRIADDTGYILKTPVLRCVLLFWFIESTMLMSYQGLWCMKWSSLAFPAFERLTSFSGVAVSLGVIVSGRFGDLFLKNSSRSEKCYGSGWLGIAAILLITAVKFLPQTIVAAFISLALDFFYGFAGGSIVLHAGALARESTDSRRNANIMGVINGFGCFVQQLSQWGTGVGIDLFGKKSSLNGAFGLTYLVVAAIAIAFVLYSRKTLWSKK